MIRGRTWMLILVMVAALLVTAASAGAKPGYFVFPRYRSIEFNLKSSNGFEIFVEKQGHRVLLMAADARSTVAYAPRSSVPKNSGIRFTLPGLGRISVQFRPQGPPHRSTPDPFPGCRGGELVKQPGQFIGTIEFRGERDYTAVQTNRAKGVIETHAKEICKVSPGDDSELPIDKTELWVKSETGRKGVGFDVSMHGDPIDLISFGASVVERRQEMMVFRHTFVNGEQGDLVVGDTRPYPLSATVTPPAPFSGWAEYQRTPDGMRSWTGTLAVSLPGLDRVPLTGPDFSPRLCQLSGCSGSLVDGHRLPWQSSHDQLRFP
jgi:hypothetical protein